MDHATQILLFLTGGWGVMLFITLAKWLTTARNTLEPGTRSRRLAMLKIRWYIGIILGGALMSYTAWHFIQLPPHVLPKLAWVGWAIVWLIESYFLTRCHLLNVNFRKHAPLMHFADSTTSIIAFLGSFIAFVSAV